MAIRFDGKVAIVTGSGGGLGRAHALELARRGAKVVINDLGGSVDGSGGSSDAAKKVVEEIKAFGGQAIANGASVTDDAGVAHLVKQTLDEFGRIDILINNAGGYHKGMGKRLEELTDDEWREGIDTNLTGQFYCCRAVITQMLKQQSGKIINIASGWGLRGGKNVFAYACAKGAVLQLTRSLAVTYAKKNIHINCIVPGIFEGAAQFFQGGKFIPLGRIGQDAELGPLALFLASDASNHMNGSFVTIDGGGLAGGIAPNGSLPRQIG